MEKSGESLTITNIKLRTKELTRVEGVAHSCVRYSVHHDDCIDCRFSFGAFFQEDVGRVGIIVNGVPGHCTQHKLRKWTARSLVLARLTCVQRRFGSDLCSSVSNPLREFSRPNATRKNYSLSFNGQPITAYQGLVGHVLLLRATSSTVTHFSWRIAKKIYFGQAYTSKNKLYQLLEKFPGGCCDTIKNTLNYPPPLLLKTS